MGLGGWVEDPIIIISTSRSELNGPGGEPVQMWWTDCGLGRKVHYIWRFIVRFIGRYSVDSVVVKGFEGPRGGWRSRLKWQSNSTHDDVWCFQFKY